MLRVLPDQLCQQKDKVGGHRPRHGSDHVENLEQHCLGNCGIKFTDIEGRGGGIGGSSRRMVGGNRRVNGGRSRSGHRRLWGWLAGNLWNGGGRHIAGVFVLIFFLFDKVVTAGKLFYGCARHNRDEKVKENGNRKDATHTEDKTATADLGFYIYMI